MNFKHQETATKLRGGYYTPDDIADYLCRWVLESDPSSILEPSCGDGAFIRSMNRIRRSNIHITGVELDSIEAAKAAANFKTKQRNSEIVNRDFLKWSLEQLDNGREFDAAIGNPPYIRYQYLDAEAQAMAEKVFKRYHLPFTKHTNAWVPFIIASIGLLRPGGRIAMVVPAEILHVLHAGSLRQFLLTECKRILLIDPTELLFEEALQGTVLLMAEKKLNQALTSKGVAIVTASKADLFSTSGGTAFTKARFVESEALNGKWMKLLLTKNELDVFERARLNRKVSTFDELASVDVGIVTGANKFFLVNDDTVKHYHLESYAKPMFGRSEHCPGLVYDKKLYREQRERGLPANFLHFGNIAKSALPAKVRQYIELGESEGLHNRYKCRIRKPWFDVPSVYSTEIAMLKRAHHYPRLILNKARAYTTDTAYRIKLKDANLTGEQLVYSFINSLTALTAELEGRHYGGGVLELVPSEIEKLLVPVANKKQFDLDGLDKMVRQNLKADTLLAQQDRIILGSVGFTQKDQQVIHGAWMHVRDRRQRLLGSGAKLTEGDSNE